MIFDQRHMTGPVIHESPEDVQSYWQVWAEQNGFRNRVAGEVVRDLLPLKAVLEAYVSDSRWVADCPECGGGIACWIENPRGCCLDCGRVYKIRFPNDWRDIERVLEARPVANRHFLPGDDLVFLKVENLTHGVGLG